MQVKWPKSVPAELRTGWRLLLTLYWWLWALFLPETVKRNLVGLSTVLDTPLKVQAFLWANIRYTPDKTVEDDWQKAERTFERRAGDCEDWAIFANYCLRERYLGFFLCMYTRDSGHATYIVSEGGDDSWVSVGTYGLNRHRGKPPDIVSDWSGFQDWTTAVLMDEGMMVLEVWYR